MLHNNLDRFKILFLSIAIAEWVLWRRVDYIKQLWHKILKTDLICVAPPPPHKLVWKWLSRILSFVIVRKSFGNFKWISHRKQYRYTQYRFWYIILLFIMIRGTNILIVYLYILIFLNSWTQFDPFVVAVYRFCISV